MTLTWEQFDKLVTKDYLNDRITGLVTKKYFDEKFDIIITAVDGLTKNVKDFQDELASNQAAHDRFEESIVGLNGRVKVLEAK